MHLIVEPPTRHGHGRAGPCSTRPINDPSKALWGVRLNEALTGAPFGNIQPAADATAKGFGPAAEPAVYSVVGGAPRAFLLPRGVGRFLCLRGGHALHARLKAQR